jgi:hypothetical protein
VSSTAAFEEGCNLQHTQLGPGLLPATNPAQFVHACHPVLIIHCLQDTVVLNVARTLACNRVLTELGLSKHKLVDSQLETLVTYGLLRNTSLTSLDLRANKLSGFSGGTQGCVVSCQGRREVLSSPPVYFPRGRGSRHWAS